MIYERNSASAFECLFVCFSNVLEFCIFTMNASVSECNFKQPLQVKWLLMTDHEGTHSTTVLTDVSESFSKMILSPFDRSSSSVISVICDLRGNTIVQNVKLRKWLQNITEFVKRLKES